MFIDSHCHLTLDDFQDDLDDVILRADKAGIEKIIVPGMDLPTSKYAVELSEKYEIVNAAIGVHPQDSKKFTVNQIEQFKDLTEHPKVVAIGEIGLDYYWDYAPREVQNVVLKEFLNLALECQLPVILHNREAFFDLMENVNETKFKELTGVFHCFSEDAKTAQRVIDLGFAVSFTGTVTFKNSKSAGISKEIPLQNQLLETDAPFMAPVPYRGKRNEPGYVKELAEKQAELRNISVEEVGSITTDHAYRLFPKLRN